MRPCPALGHSTNATLVHLDWLLELLRSETNGYMLMRKYVFNLQAFMELSFLLPSIWCYGVIARVVTTTSTAELCFMQMYHWQTGSHDSL